MMQYMLIVGLIADFQTTVTFGFWAIAPVLAQDSAPESKRWIAVVIALVLIICIAVVSCINPRRGRD